MPGMPGNISKGPILKKFDSVVNTGSGALDLLKHYYQNRSMNSWLAEGVTKNILRGQGDRLDKDNNPTKPETPIEDDITHVKRHWFGQKGASKKPRVQWWPELHKMDDIFQEGLKQALRLCLYEEEPMNLGPLTFVKGAPNRITRMDGNDWPVANGAQIHIWGPKKKNCGVKTVSGGGLSPTIDVAEEIANEVADPSDLAAARVYVPRGTQYTIDSYWVCAGESYELISCVNATAKCVTFLIFTPKPRFTRTHGWFGHPEENPHDRDEIWVTKASTSASKGEFSRPIPGRQQDDVVVNVQIGVQDITESYDQ